MAAEGFAVTKVCRYRCVFMCACTTWSISMQHIFAVYRCVADGQYLPPQDRLAYSIHFIYFISQVHNLMITQFYYLSTTIFQVASMKRSLRSVESTGDTASFASELSVSFFNSLQEGCYSFKTLFEVKIQGTLFCSWKRTIQRTIDLPAALNYEHFNCLFYPPCNHFYFFLFFQFFSSQEHYDKPEILNLLLDWVQGQIASYVEILVPHVSCSLFFVVACHIYVRLRAADRRGIGLFLFSSCL